MYCDSIAHRRRLQCSVLVTVLVFFSFFIKPKFLTCCWMTTLFLCVWWDVKLGTLQFGKIFIVIVLRIILQQMHLLPETWWVIELKVLICSLILLNPIPFYAFYYINICSISWDASLAWFWSNQFTLQLWQFCYSVYVCFKFKGQIKMSNISWSIYNFSQLSVGQSFILSSFIAFFLNTNTFGGLDAWIFFLFFF